MLRELLNSLSPKELFFKRENMYMCICQKKVLNSVPKDVKPYLLMNIQYKPDF